MSELTPEEKALLEAAEPTNVVVEAPPEPIVVDEAPKKRPGRARKDHADEHPAEGRPHAHGHKGPHSPAQFDDDGWGDLPVQMRG